MASVFISSSAEIVLVDSRTRPGTVTLPVTNSIPYRVVSFKDQYGTFSNSTFTLSTQLGESFDDGTTSKIFSNAFSYLNLYATSSKWMVMNATQTVQQTISSLTVNQLTFGTGAGWVQFGPLQASIVSTIQVQAQTGYINNLLIGNQSTINSAQFYGLFGNYNNTAIAEISTGAGTQELLLFKGSSSSDRVRVQTTGNFVVETGVSARLFNSNTTQTLSNATPAFIINTSSNVGIQTASPGATLDVAGISRALTLSSLALNVSSLNGALPGGGITTLNLLSTTGGLQREFATADFLSSPNLLSTTGGLQREINTAGFLSSLNLLSTVAGLGSSDYVSTLSLYSSINEGISSFSTALGEVGRGNLATIPSSLSTFELFTSSLLASTISSSNLTTELLNVSSISAWNVSSTYVVGDTLIAQTSVEILDGALFVINNSGLIPITAGFATSNANVNLTFGINELIKWEQIVRDIPGNPMSFVYAQGPEILTLDGKNEKVGIGVKTPQYELDISGTLFASSLATVSVAMLDTTTNDFNFLTTSSGVLLLNGVGITGGGGGAGVAQLVAGSNISLSPAGGTGIVTVNTTSPSGGQLISTVEGLGTYGYLSTGGLGYFSTVFINMLPQDAPFWDSNVPVAGFDPEPNPLALDVFGSARILKNIYIGSTTTVIGTGAIVTPSMNTTSVSTATAIISSIGFVNPESEIPLYLEMSNNTLVFNGVEIGGGGGIATIPDNLSTFAIFTSSIQASTVTTNDINFGGGFGYLEMPDIYPNTIFTSTITVTGVTTLSSILGATISTTSAAFSNIAVSTINNQIPQPVVETEAFLVAVSSSPAGRVAVSYDDGQTWFFRGTVNGASDFVQGIAWNGSLWVAVGRGGGNIATSPDGITWTGRSAPYSNAGWGIAWNGRVWVTGGYNNATLGYSFDGITWFTLGLSIFTSEGHNIAWNGTIFVATGSGTNTLAYSYDGINWVGLGTSIFSTAGWGVAWNGTLFVAVGQGTNVFATSPNGINWTGRGSSGITSIGYNVAWNGSLWVAVGTGTNTIATSTDGISWTGRTNGLTSQGRSIAWSGSLWVAGGSGTFAIVTSPDGITWTGRNSVGLTSVTGMAARRVLPFTGTFNPQLQPSFNLGIVSTATSLQFFGLTGLYNNSVIAEVSTGTGTQELLLFKGASASDRIRFQTTGDVRFETGVSARTWNTNTTTTLSNATPAMIINTSSNVGIQTTPAAGFALDVAGVIRGTTLSTLRIQMSSITGIQYTGSNTDISSLITFSMSSGTTSASSFTGRWNDAQYYVLQTI